MSDGGAKGADSDAKMQQLSDAHQAECAMVSRGVDDDWGNERTVPGHRGMKG